ncbi:MAG: GNAT family N-acetyltransferase [candidate division Zixibacteria bacterium]|nr:GNAT family N-acetyltransferase [candidate division Zixibacteria bacterium]
MIYTDSPEGLTANNLQGFFVGWLNPPSPETLLRILHQSDHIELAVDDQTSMVVGFISAISDNVLCAYIPLLEVLPDYQGNGIGKELVRRVITHYKDLYMIDLICDENLQAYYEKLGMVKASGMMIRRYDKQSGR